MGYRVGSTCYATEVEGVDAFFSGVVPVFDASSNPFAYTRWSKSTGVWAVDHFHVSNAGVMTLQWTAAIPPKELGVCDMPNDPTTMFTDGMLLGWGVVLAMVLAWGVKLMTPDGWRIRA